MRGSESYGVATVTVEGEVCTITSADAPRLWGRGRSGVVWWETGMELCSSGFHPDFTDSSEKVAGLQGIQLPVSHSIGSLNLPRVYCIHTAAPRLWSTRVS